MFSYNTVFICTKGKLDDNMIFSSHSICAVCKVGIELTHDNCPELYTVVECPICSDKIIITEITNLNRSTLAVKTARLSKH
jgi:DNA-directed RNA polymerase subunit RPC12/RpoP